MSRFRQTATWPGLADGRSRAGEHGVEALEGSEASDSVRRTVRGTRSSPARQLYVSLPCREGVRIGANPHAYRVWGLFQYVRTSTRDSGVHMTRLRAGAGTSQFGSLAGFPVIAMRR